MENNKSSGCEFYEICDERYLKEECLDENPDCSLNKLYGNLRTRETTNPSISNKTDSFYKIGIDFKNPITNQPKFKKR